MSISERLRQCPAPGSRRLLFQGDRVRFSLSVPENAKGSAWLRTNIGQGKVARSEIIRQVRQETPPLGRDWFDIPMSPGGNGDFSVTVGLTEVGHFEGKCFFLKDGETAPLWPTGENAVINVEPAHACCGNVVYNAFVRQFGPNKSGGGVPDQARADCISDLDASGYTVIPKSGTFRDFIRELDFIVDRLGCRHIQLLPIHPTPTTYARMGRFGSPYAALGFTSVDPAQAQFDPSATPMEQFLELVDAVHARNARLILDVAVNHTGWAASLHETHPQWLVRGADGRIQAPGAWGIVWEDLTKLDYSYKDLWMYMADVFLTWRRRGVDGFRCDAGYMIPTPAWRFIVSAVRDQYPDTVFFLEGLGGKISVTRDILNAANFDWAYSELFQNDDRGQIEHYLPGAFDIAQSDGLMIHFAETHDNNRLAARSKTYAKMRTALCALFSQNGGFAFANGVEWFATEKINVHESPSLNWDAADNQVEEIALLNRLLKCHPAFHDGVDASMIQKGEGNVIVLCRRHRETGKTLLIPVNLSDRDGAVCSWNAADAPWESFWDLLSGKQVQAEKEGDVRRLALDPGAVFCLSPDPEDLELIRQTPAGGTVIPDRILKQRIRAKALAVYQAFYGVCDLSGLDADFGREMVNDPAAFCRSLNPHGRESRIIPWQWPADRKREVMVPPGFFLLVRAPAPFRARLTLGEKTIAQDESLPQAGGGFFILFPPVSPEDRGACRLHIFVYGDGGCVRAEAPVLLLPETGGDAISPAYSRSDILHGNFLFLAANGRGGMLRANLAWGKLLSRYDALLAANLNPDYPEDRRIMLTRCRMWLVYQGFSQELCIDCLDCFRRENGRGVWTFHAPMGQGEHLFLTAALEMPKGRNAAVMRFYRRRAMGKGQMADDKPVRLILRPDIEDRSFHETTKAYLGPERDWPARVTSLPDGFAFDPAPDPETGRRLLCRLPEGLYTHAPEWHYMVRRDTDAERGMDPDSDLFSPGYFSAEITGGQMVRFIARATAPGQTADVENLAGPENEAAPHDAEHADCTDGDVQCIQDAAESAMAHFIVKRRALSTVIAGYPWFLDWGRDTLIVVRGMIAAGHLDVSRAVLMQFAAFEQDGTLPNMIRGNDAGNRDTSDAPLWFFVACSELVAAEKRPDFLNASCGDRSIRQILMSMVASIMAGTPNGVAMDSDSGLVFSPSHFTWMDTNHPAGTPRQGYPVEIQALWHFALSFLSRIDDENAQKWAGLAARVKTSLRDLFYLKDLGYLADCLYADPGAPAAGAEADDALRPNQIFAVTLGALTDQDIAVGVLESCLELLVPGAIRSLADRPVRRPLPIERDGVLLNDPLHPYQGVYTGDEDTRRKPAYHNGTAWTWVFPSFCEAWANVFGAVGKDAALAWLNSSARIIREGCAGHVPEILDGDFPHAQRGCDAQAWGASELFRVCARLSALS